MVLIGEKLRELRKSRGLTQKQVGELLGVSISTISSYESDSRRPSYEVLFRYVESFRTSADYILGTNKLRKDNLSRLNYEDRKFIDELAEFFISKERRY